MPDYSTHAAPAGGPQAGGRRASVKTLKRMLKKAGLKTSGRKAALTRRAKKAHLKMGGGPGPDGKEIVEVKGGMKCSEEGADPADCEADGGRRRRRGSRKSRRGGFLKY